MKRYLDIFLEIFSKIKYIKIFIVSTILFYILNIIILNFGSLKSIYLSEGFLTMLKFFYLFSIGISSSMEKISLFTFIAITIFVGIIVSLIVYKAEFYSGKKSKNFFGTVGIIIGALAPGCAACGVGVISLFGLGGIIIGFLPLKGLEISFLAIALLIIGISRAMKDLTNPITCEFQVHNMKGGKNE